MRPLLFFFFASLSYSASLTITPGVITDCQDGRGVAQLAWNGTTGTVQIHLTNPAGPLLTTSGDAAGAVATGPWVTDGAIFVLVDSTGTAIASATAHVDCGGTSTQSYFPLQVGNTWIYRLSDRLSTNRYATRSITGTETIGDKTYFDLTEGTVLRAKLRSDENGVIWSATATGEQVFLDGSSSAAKRGAYTGPIGTFPDSVTFSGLINPLEFDTSTYVRGVGPAHLVSNLETGSSGGLIGDYQLVEVLLPGVHYSIPFATVNLSIESTDLNLTAKSVENCALPCLFAACGLGGGQPDPTGTYRPCTAVRVDVTAPAQSDVQVQFADASGANIYTAHAAPGGAPLYFRLPIYTVPDPQSIRFDLLPMGDYKLTARVTNAGNELATSSLAVHVR